MLMTEMIDEFIEAKSIEVAAATLVWYRQMLRPWAAWLEAATPGLTLAALEARHVREYLRAQQALSYSERTVASRYDVLVTCLNWAEVEYEGFVSPVGEGRRRRVKRPKVRKKKRVYTRHREYEQLLASIQLVSWLDARDKAMLVVMFTTGMRRKELLGLRVDDLDYVSRLVSVTRKGDNMQDLPLVHDARFALFVYRAMRPAWTGPDLWLGTRGRSSKPTGRLKETGLRLMIQRRCAAAGIGPQPHAPIRSAAAAARTCSTPVSILSTCGRCWATPKRR